MLVKQLPIDSNLSLSSFLQACAMHGEPEMLVIHGPEQLDEAQKIVGEAFPYIQNYINILFDHTLLKCAWRVQGKNTIVFSLGG